MDLFSKIGLPIATAFLLHPLCALAQSGTLDTNFLSGSATDRAIYAVAQQADGKIVVGGDFTVACDGVRGGIARLNPDGTLDSTFGQGQQGADWTVRCVAVQADNSVIIGGDFNSVNGVSRPHLARLEADGSLDTTFRNDGNSSYLRALAVNSDGTILIGGTLVQVQGSNVVGVLARLGTDGSLDPTFADPFALEPSAALYSVAVQPDGRIVIGGYFGSRGAVARLNSDGSLDWSFQSAQVITNGSALAVALQPDGKILVGGTFTTATDPPKDNLIRLNGDGSIDTTFATDLRAPSISTIAVLANGNILLDGDFGYFTSQGQPQSRNRVALLDPKGSLLPVPIGDPSVGTGVRGVNEVVLAMTASGTGALIVGDFTAFSGAERYRIARVSQDGTLDNTFTQPPTGPNSQVLTLAVQDDGRILIGGAFSLFNGLPKPGVLRLHANGTLDSSFQPVFQNGLGGYVRVLVVQPDGKIIVGGESYFICNSSICSFLGRLNANGTTDSSFGAYDSRIMSPMCLALQEDGKILVGTHTGLPGIFRLNTDGSTDSTFNITHPGSVFSVAVQKDGKILIGGSFIEHSPYRQYSLARLDNTGQADPSFQAGEAGPDGPVESIVVQPNNQILIGGEFSVVNGVHCPGIARLNPDGSVDPGFQGGLFETPFRIIYQPNGGILAAGRMRNGISRLLPDGSRDINFTPEGFLSSDVYCDVLAVAQDASGGILLGGSFTSIGGVTRRYLARLWADQPVLSIARSAPGMVLSWPAIWTNCALDHKTTIGEAWSNVTATPQNNGTNQVVNIPSEAASGFYRLRR